LNKLTRELRQQAEINTKFAFEFGRFSRSENLDIAVRMKRSISSYFRHVSLTINKILVLLDHGQFKCAKCRVFNTTDKDDWLKHVAKYHNKELARLVEERQEVEEVLNEAVASISDNEVIKSLKKLLKKCSDIFCIF
jgi:hypothetical protein